MIAPRDCVAVFAAVFWKSGVVLGGALAVSRLLRKRSADLRRLVLSTAVVAMFVAAAALPVLPRWTAAIPFRLGFHGPAAGVPAAPQMDVPPGEAREIALPESGGPMGAAAPGRADLTPWLIPLAWLAVAATLLARFVASLYRLRKLRTASEEVPASELPAPVAGFGRRVGMWRNESIGGPVTWGIFRPVILVPPSFEELPAECREAVLCHELAHIQAYDFLVRCLAEIARAVIWFQPLAWVVLRQLREEQELACDNRVLATGGKPSAYAKLLMDWDGRPGLDSLIAVGIAHRSCLRRRLYALLDPDLRRENVAATGVAGACFAGLAAALPLAALSVAPAVPALPAVAHHLPAVPAGRAMVDGAPPVEVAQVRPPVLAARPPAPPPAPLPAPQTATPPVPRFEAVSVKPCQPGDGPGRSGRGDMGANRGIDPAMPPGIGGYFRVEPGKLDVTCGSILTMVSVAYIEHGSPLLNNPGGPKSEAQRILGVPNWALDARYTIHATTSDPAANQPTRIGEGRESRPGPAEVLLYRMLQGILEDRFHLAVHRAVDQAPMYALKVAEGGLKLKPMQEGDCLMDGPPGWPAGGKPPCGWVGWDVNGPNRRLLLGGISMNRFARELAELVLDRNVIDQTGISGNYVTRLEFTPDDTTRCLGPARWCAVDASSTIPPAGNIFAALGGQFGLKLDPITGPRERMVIDRVEQPSGN